MLESGDIPQLDVNIEVEDDDSDNDDGEVENQDKIVGEDWGKCWISAAGLPAWTLASGLGEPWRSDRRRRWRFSGGSGAIWHLEGRSDKYEIQNVKKKNVETFVNRTTLFLTNIVLLNGLVWSLH